MSEYEELKRKLDDSIKRDEARQKILRSKREEKKLVKKAGGGRAIAKQIMGRENDTDFSYGFNEDTEISSIESVSDSNDHNHCMGRVICERCKKFHGYCREVQEEKEKMKMLPTGDSVPTAGKRKGGLNWLRMEDLNTTPQEAKILMVKFQEDGPYGARVNLKLAFKGEIRYLGIKPTKKDPRYKVMLDKFGPDENNWVDTRILLFAEKDDFSEGFNMRVSIPDGKPSRR